MKTQNETSCTCTSPVRTAHMCAYSCVQLWYTTLNSSDNLHSYPPDNRHSSDDVCLVIAASGGELKIVVED